MNMYRTLTILAATLALSACGGGGSSGQQPAANTPPPSGGIVRTGSAFGPISNFGSIVVNGVRYNTSAATFSIDDAPGTESTLKVGQMVLVNGTLDAGLATGSATSVRFDENVEGPIQSIDAAAGTLVVLRQLIRTGPATSFDDGIQPPAQSGLSVGDIVEVSGQVMADGSISATRIELKPPGGLLEVHGLVSNLDTSNRRFNINALVVDYSGAQMDNFPGGQIAAGHLVEAKGQGLDGSGALVATRVEFEGPPAAGNAVDRAEVEGFITRFASAQDFDVGGIPVTTNNATAFEGGTAADLGLNVKVEVEGPRDAAGRITAVKVDIRRAAAVRLTALVDSVDRPASTLVALGITVAIDALTRMEDKSNARVEPLTIAALNAGDYIALRGSELPAGSGRILAALLEREDPDPDTILQGFVTSVADPSFTVLAVTVETTGATVFRDVDDTVISRSQFFARVGAGTLVKAKGLESSSTTIVAEEVELE